MRHFHEPEHACTYALTCNEALGVAEQMGWTDTESWTVKGRYWTTQPSRKLLDLLKPYLVRPGDSKAPVNQAASASPRS